MFIRILNYKYFPLFFVLLMPRNFYKSLSLERRVSKNGSKFSEFNKTPKSFSGKNLPFLYLFQILSIIKSAASG